MSIQQQPLLAYGAAGGGDPNFANVASLLHFDGVAGTTVFTDQTGKTWTPVNGPAINTSQSVFGGASGFFSNGNIGYISTPDHADWNFGSGDFTLEGRIRFISVSGVAGVWGKPTSLNYSPFMVYRNTTSLVFYVSLNNTAWDITLSIGTVAIDTWYAWAVCRVGTTFYTFLNGTNTASTTLAGSLHSSADSVFIGTHTAGTSNNMLAYADEFRATKGVGRYTANYTLATAAFPNS